MRSPFPSLALFYAKSLYGLGAPRASRGLKGVLKALGIAALVLLVVGDISVLFFTTDLGLYNALKPTGRQSLLLLHASTTASLIVLVLGLLTALSTYFMSQAETALLSLPIKPRHLLGAKLGAVYLSELALAFLLVAVAAGIYGWMERPSPGFYLAALASALAAPLVPLAAIYLLLVPLMRAFRPLRNKNVVMVVGGLIATAAAVAFNIFVQGSAGAFADPAAAAASAGAAGQAAAVARIGESYPPAFLAWKAMTAGGLEAGLSALGSVALGLGAVVAVAAALGPMYAASLVGFDERRLKRVSGGGYIARAIRRRSPLASLFLREWRLMNREPVYFVNGPFVVLLMPVILVVMYFAQRETLGATLAQLGSFLEGPLPMLAAAAFGGFLGSATSVSCTALSRDAKALPYLKALPLGPDAYMGAKLLHALSFSAFGALVGAIGGAAVLGLGLAEAAGAFVMALAFSSFVDIAGLWLDTLNPRLSWDNPTAAMKQNVNAVVVILGTMGLLGALGYATTLLGLGKAGFVALYGGLFAAAGAGAAALLPAYARKKLGEIEV